MYSWRTGHVSAALSIVVTLLLTFHRLVPNTLLHLGSLLETVLVWLILAVPVGARDTCHEMESEVDETVCAFMPAHFHGVGQFYEDFSQTTDEEVRGLLALANRRGREQPAEA